MASLSSQSRFIDAGQRYRKMIMQRTEYEIAQGQQKPCEHAVHFDTFETFENIAQHVERLKQIRITMFELRSRLNIRIKEMPTPSGE